MSELVEPVVEQHEETKVVPDAAPPHSLGQQLANKREQLGWSVTDVASHLKLARRQVEAMEADNYVALPTMAMTRGFIRSYAKLLDLDPTILLESPIMVARSIPTSTQNALPAYSAPRKKFAYKWLFLVALLLLLGLSIQQGWGLALQNAWHTFAQRFTLPVETKAHTESLSKTVSENINKALPSGVDQVVAPAFVAEHVASDNYTVHDNKLTFNFRQDSWIEIKRADKTMVLSHLAKAGSVESIDMTQPVNITIGNVAGVEATLRGRPVDLVEAAAKTNVARLNLE